MAGRFRLHTPVGHSRDGVGRDGELGGGGGGGGSRIRPWAQIGLTAKTEERLKHFPGLWSQSLSEQRCYWSRRLSR